MSTITVDEAQTYLAEIIDKLQPDEEILITKNDQPIARIVGTTPAEPKTWPCKAGSAAGKVWMAPDFDAPLEDFKEYME